MGKFRSKAGSHRLSHRAGHAPRRRPRAPRRPYHAARRAPQRQGEGGDAAVIAGEEYLVLPQPADLGDETEYAALERVAGIAVGCGLVALVDADGEHPRVLARAVTVDRTRLFAAADQLVCL